MSAFLCFLACVGRGCAMGRYPVHGIVPTCIKGFIISELILIPNRPEGLTMKRTTVHYHYTN